jgi:hypothetical protein
MGKKEDEQYPNKPLEFNGHDAYYSFWPNEIYYLVLESIRKPKADGTTPNAPKEPKAAKRDIKNLVVCFFCNHTNCTKIIYTRLRSMQQFAYLVNDTFFQAHRTHMVNMDYVQCLQPDNTIGFTHSVLHPLKVGKRQVVDFKKRLKERRRNPNNRQ